jgi:hypothetical protein
VANGQVMQDHWSPSGIRAGSQHKRDFELIVRRDIAFTEAPL